MVICYSRSSRPLYLLGGFSDETVTMVVDFNAAVIVLSLRSTYEEADQHIMIHVLHCVNVLGEQRILVHSNATDAIVSCVYYCAKYPAISELWVRTGINTLIPIHMIAVSLGQEKCMLLPYFHAMSGKDDTSFIYRMGKKKLWKSLPLIDTRPLQSFAETPETEQISPELIQYISTSLVIRAYGGMETDTLASLRTRKFLAGNSGLHLSLPPTDDALQISSTQIRISLRTQSLKYIAVYQLYKYNLTCVIKLA